MVARWAHNPKVIGSNPVPATNYVFLKDGLNAHFLLVKQREQMQNKIEDILKKYHLKLWYFIKTGAKSPIWKIYIDDQQYRGQVSLSLCEQVSKELATIIDDSIEVSSPGIERNLYTLEHYRLFLHKKVSLAFRKEGTLMKKIGFLEAVKVDQVIFKEESGTISEINFQDIVWSKLHYDFRGGK